jgi:PhoH-like ATPase
MSGLFRLLLPLLATSVAWGATCEDSLTSKSNAGQWKGKAVVFDTNVVLNDPTAIYKFPGATLIISGTLLEEVDGKKNDVKTGRASRAFSREILKLIESSSSSDGIPLPGGGILIVDHDNYMKELERTTLDPKKKDNELLAIALHYSKNFTPENTVLLTDDMNVRIKALGLKIPSKAFELEWVAPANDKSDLLHGFELSDEQLAAFLRDGRLSVPEGLTIAPNEFVMFTSPTTKEGDATTVGRYRYNRKNPEQSAIVQLPEFEKSNHLPGAPRNLEQAMALDLLLDPEVVCVILDAKAGTGKTFLAMLAATHFNRIGESNKEDRLYEQFYISRPTVHLGQKDPGALPGDIKKKYAEWAMPFLDNYNALERNRQELNSDKAPASFHPIAELPKQYEILPFEFMRGRSLKSVFAMIDEFQNTNVHEAKTILTRVGEGSKIVIMGDPSQIDVGYLNATNNGLSIAVAGFTNPELSPEERSLVGVMKLVHGVRSPFSELSTKVFDHPIPVE